VNTKSSHISTSFEDENTEEVNKALISFNLAHVTMAMIAVNASIAAHLLYADARCD
jgi:hypothetical protein